MNVSYFRKHLANSRGAGEITYMPNTGMCCGKNPLFVWPDPHLRPLFRFAPVPKTTLYVPVPKIPLFSPPEHTPPVDHDDERKYR